MNSDSSGARNCGAVHHVSPFDREPIYRLVDGEVEEKPTNDWRVFKDRHAGHRLEPLLATGEDYLAHGKPFDPMSVRFLEASNGSETLLLRRSRSTIEEPVQYEVLEGRLIHNGTTVEIHGRSDSQGNEIAFLLGADTAAPGRKDFVVC